MRIHNYKEGYIKLVRILKLLNYYGRYINNMCSNYNYEYIGCKYPFYIDDADNSLSNSFFWDDSREGDYLWRRIYNILASHSEISEIIEAYKHDK